MHIKIIEGEITQLENLRTGLFEKTSASESRERHFSKSSVLVTVVTVIVLSTLLFATGCSSSSGVAATVNGKEISEQQVTETIEDFRTQAGLEEDEAWAMWLQQNSYTPESLRSQVIETLADQKLAEQAIDEFGINIDDSEIEEQIESMKNQYDSEEDWQNLLSEYNTTEKDLRESIKTSLLSSKLEAYFEAEDSITADEYKQNADIIIKDMPEKLSYDIDISMYVTSSGELRMQSEVLGSEGE